MKLIKRSNRLLPAPEGQLRACLYLRVWTGRQAESDLSIPDQRKSVQAYYAAHGWPVIAEHVEPGASALDDNRPAFQTMITCAEDADRPYDVIVVHSLSRFFRDAFGLEMYVRRLAKVGVRLVSITQELGDDPAAEMMRQMFALFDEYSSHEYSKHVQHAMNENARQGFYNGSNRPLGYTLEEVERRGSRMTKRLIVDPVEAETIRLIFRLCRHGDGRSDPLGVKAICCHLNERGYRTRAGASFGVATIHRIPTNQVYVGEWSFNKRCSKTGAEKPKAEHIAVAVPPIIALDAFEAVQATLKAHNPRVTPARVVTGPILLTGLATCTTCGGAMTLWTGTSKSKKVHSYDSCSTKGRRGATGCSPVDPNGHARQDRHRSPRGRVAAARPPAGDTGFALGVADRAGGRGGWSPGSAAQRTDGGGGETAAAPPAGRRGRGRAGRSSDGAARGAAGGAGSGEGGIGSDPRGRSESIRDRPRTDRALRTTDARERDVVRDSVSEGVAPGHRRSGRGGSGRNPHRRRREEPGNRPDRSRRLSRAGCSQFCTQVARPAGIEPAFSA
ncbi:UNVERIFIED_CONTAM: recombinase family protein [Methylobacteriaceae bacterium AG10]|nr:recombinase family protein [Methylobacteriaceae bacterium AG10]